MSVINGTGKPRLTLTFSDASSVTIDLPYCQRYRERPAVVQTLHPLVDESVELDRKGTRIRFTLDYSRLLDGSVLATLAPLFRRDLTAIQLIPRVDNLYRTFTVYLVSAGEVERAFSAGHKGVVLEFETTQVLESFPTGTGTTFGSWWDE